MLFILKKNVHLKNKTKKFWNLCFSYFFLLCHIQCLFKLISNFIWWIKNWNNLGNKEPSDLKLSGFTNNDRPPLFLGLSSSSHQLVLWRSHRPHVPHAWMCPPCVRVSTTTTHSCVCVSLCKWNMYMNGKLLMWEITFFKSNVVKM